MAAQEEIFDNPAGWMAGHSAPTSRAAARRATSVGVSTLLLTTRGRRPARLRRTALIYGQDGDRYLPVGSNGGARKHPVWYLNLVEHPEVYLQVGQEKFAARARPASAEEKPRLWQLMAALWPQYDIYQGQTARDIPLVVVERM